jgi:hypothetical protein
MTQPDFMIIGAMKCGTTTLQAQLALQTGVFMTTPKEPNYFSDDNIYANGAAWYQSLFSDAQPNDITGEASTHYTKLPTYPDTIRRMQAALNRPKLIYMIRNPVERAMSHYIHEWSEGRMGGDPVAEFDAHSEMVDYGRFGYQIRPFVEAFGADQICLTSLERLKVEPDTELARIAAFIGFPSPAIWHHDLSPQNVSANRVRKFPLHSLLIDNPIATALRRALIPKATRERIREARTIGTRPDWPDSLRVRLEQVFLKDRAVLADMFPDAPALNDEYPFAK